MSGSAQTGDGLFDLLVRLDARCRTRGAGLPDEAPVEDTWAGVLFRVRGQAMLAPLEEIAEVLEPPSDITVVPGTKPWLLGVANNRGTLLPIFDLAALVLGGAAAAGETDRILVVRQNDLPCGLLVSSVVGIRHFEQRSRMTGRGEGLGALEPFVDAAFALDAGPVPVLGLERMLVDPLLNAAPG